MVILNLAPRSMCFFVREAVAVALGQAARIGVGRAREIFERLEKNAAAPVTHWWDRIDCNTIASHAQQEIRCCDVTSAREWNAGNISRQPQ